MLLRQWSGGLFPLPYLSSWAELVARDRREIPEREAGAIKSN